MNHINVGTSFKAKSRVSRVPDPNSCSTGSGPEVHEVQVRDPSPVFQEFGARTPVPLVRGPKSKVRGPSPVFQEFGTRTPVPLVRGPKSMKSKSGARPEFQMIVMIVISGH